ncbi:MAG: C4-dicarboxylate transporter DctQ [Erysipelotrichaceae bacterium]|nr:MAG: C4-dicarboxylate transporter DctQ [Erysipelotrichaceae bacterium]
MLKILNKGMSWFENGVIVIGLLSVTFVLFINVVLRIIFKEGLVWAEEYSRMAIIWIVLGGSSAAVREDVHMRITAITDFYKNEKFKFVINFIVILISIVFTVFLFYTGTRLVVSMFQTNQVTPALEIPLWWIYISIPIGGLMMTIRYIQSLIRLIKKENIVKVDLL